MIGFPTHADRCFPLVGLCPNRKPENQAKASANPTANRFIKTFLPCYRCFPLRPFAILALTQTNPSSGKSSPLLPMAHFGCLLRKALIATRKLPTEIEEFTSNHSPLLRKQLLQTPSARFHPRFAAPPVFLFPTQPSNSWARSFARDQVKAAPTQPL